MGAAAELIKIDLEIAHVRTKMKDKGSAKLKPVLDELLKKREIALRKLQRQARGGSE